MASPRCIDQIIPPFGGNLAHPPRRRKLDSATAKMKLLLCNFILVCLVSGGALAFTYDGLESGMSVEQAASHMKAKGYVWKPLLAPGQAVADMFAATSGSDSHTLMFCKGKLHTLSTDVLGGMDNFIRLVDYLSKNPDGTERFASATAMHRPTNLGPLRTISVQVFTPTNGGVEIVEVQYFMPTERTPESVSIRRRPMLRCAR